MMSGNEAVNNAKMKDSTRDSPFTLYRIGFVLVSKRSMTPTDE